MSEKNTSLATFYKGWDNYQQHLITAIAPLTREQLALRPAPHLWSIGMLATHIIAARVGWFHTWLGEGKAELAAMAEWDEWDENEEPAYSSTELVSALETTWQLIQEALNQWTVTDLEQIFTSPYTKSNEHKHSRQWIVWHVLEHDLHHGGEIALTLGMHKLKSIDL